MTTPQAPPQQPPPPVQPPPPPADSDLDSPLFVTAVAAALLTAVPVAGVVAALKVRFALSHAAWTALTAVLGDVMHHPAPAPPVSGVPGPASAQTARQNLARRAQFVVSAGKRLMSDMADWRSKPPPAPVPEPGPASGQTADLNELRRAQFAKAKRDRLAADIAGRGDTGPMAGLKAGLERERRYYDQHLAAMANRVDAAGKTDAAAAKHGDKLGWRSVLDSRTSPECRSSHGKNYLASRMPYLGFPGGVHSSCRCLPCAPWPGAPMLPLRTP